ncbi:MAG: hypothetical protein HUU11_03160 [Anaerolineales bacterium]|nr:hypothetical protein [Anaerolineales bacterium]
MSSQFSFMLSGSSSGMRLIRFFKLVGFLGGMIWFSRVLMAVALLSGILFLVR